MVSTFVPIAILVLLGSAAYVNSLGGSFHFDDEWDIVQNHHLRSWNGMLSLPLVGRWLTFFTFFVNYQMHGLEFLPGWHVVNIALHVLCVLTLYGFLSTLTESSQPTASLGCFFAAGLFAVHPLASEPVNYIRAQAVILYTIFAMLALWGLVMAHRGPSRKRRVAGILMLMLAVPLGAISKEVGGFFILALPALYVLVFIEPHVRSKKRFWVLTGIVGGFIAVNAVDWLALSGALEHTKRLLFHELAAHHFWVMTTVFWRYLSLVILPLPSRLSHDHYVQYFPARTYCMRDWDVLLGTVGLVLLILTIILLRRRKPLISFLLGFVLVGLGPYFFITTVDALIEYKFYLPLTACCALAQVPQF